MPSQEAPCLELGAAPRTPSVIASPSPSEISSASSPEPQNVRATPLFRALAMLPPEPEQPPGQDELERRLPGYRRIVIPRELTLIELLKECSGVTTDDEVLRIREAKLRVVAERVGLRRLHVLVPRLRSLTLDGSALLSLRELGIGLVHLKMLSVNRCGLTSLDGVWGVGPLREMHAAGNRIQDLHPLAVLQKLHTINLSNNPISQSSRIWTLGVCSSLRRLFLKGTPFSGSPSYRSTIISTLPMLTVLDDQPLHTDVNTDDYVNTDSTSDSDIESKQDNDTKLRSEPPLPVAVPVAGPSSQIFQEPQEHDWDTHVEEKFVRAPTVHRRRPATTENAGIRPSKPELPRRPLTAVDRPSIDAPTRLQMMNTLMDAEWRCSGSKLTSQGAVCGNLARALRRPALSNQDSEDDEHGIVHDIYPHPTSTKIQDTDALFSLRTETECLKGTQLEIVEHTMDDACRAVAAEIPRAPCHEAWVKFRKETGIEIDINFNQRPQSMDPSKALDRLERIEKETSERLKSVHSDRKLGIGKRYEAFPGGSAKYFWKETQQTSTVSKTYSDVESVLSENDSNHSICDSY